MIAIILLFVFQIYTCNAWSGIVIDGESGTQLYSSGNSSNNIQDVDFGLTYLWGQAAVMFNGDGYYIGGQLENFKITNAVTVFNPSTNTSTTSVPLSAARRYHAATVVDDTIIVCGGWNESLDRLAS